MCVLGLDQPFVLFFPGAHGVGRRHIKNTLIAKHPDRFAYPIPRKEFYIFKSLIQTQTHTQAENYNIT